MKILHIILLVLGTGFMAHAQKPIKWSFYSVKKGDKIYEIKLTALLDPGWHIYSASTPEGGPVLTKISFNKNPLTQLQGTIREIGNIQKKYEDVFEVDTKFYANKVDFIQLVKLKANAKTSVSGVVEFMVCNGHQCLPPEKKSFSVLLK